MTAVAIHANIHAIGFHANDADQSSCQGNGLCQTIHHNPILCLRKNILKPLLNTGCCGALKYLNCLHELCVTVTAVAPTADHDDKRAKSMANLTLSLYAVSLVSLPHISPSAPLCNSRHAIENLWLNLTHISTEKKYCEF